MKIIEVLHADDDALMQRIENEVPLFPGRATLIRDIHRHLRDLKNHTLAVAANIARAHTPSSPDPDCERMMRRAGRDIEWAIRDCITADVKLRCRERS